MSPRALLEPAFLTALGVLAVAAIGMDAGIRAYGIYLQKLPIYPPEARAVSRIPTETARWRRIGADESFDEETLKVLGTQNFLTRAYEEKDPPQGRRPRVMQLHAAYYTGMIDTVPHVVERCLTGGGMMLVGGPWEIDIPMDTSGWTPHPDAEPEEVGRVYSVLLDNEYSTAGGRRVRLPRGVTPDHPLRLRVSEFAGPGGRRLFAGYFFIANGGWVSSANDVRLLAFDLTDDYAYYLKVQFGSIMVESPQDLAALAGSMLDDLLGELMRCVPDWVEVEHGRYPADNPRRARSGR